jgi:hypothetical protein
VGGQLVMPVGPAYTTQHLTVVEKIAPGKTTMRGSVPLPRTLFHRIARPGKVNITACRIWSKPDHVRRYAA